MTTDAGRERLRTLNRGLLQLHSVLLERERRVYESRRGPVAPYELLHLLINDQEFAWLRSLSGLMARIDEVVDAGEPVTADDASAAFREAHRLLKSGESGPFQDRYRDALQESPDVVMAHARVSAVLRSRG